MKKILFAALACLSMSHVTALADTEYVDTSDVSSTSSYRGEKAQALAKILTEWEQTHSDKKIICITANVVNYGTRNDTGGFWITFEYRSKKPE